MAKRRRSLHSKYAPLAQATAALATDPERRGLRALVEQVYAERDADIAASRTTSRVQRGAIREAAPRVQQVYDEARAGLSAVTGDYSHPAAGIAADFAKLGPAAGSIAEAARAESEAAQRRTIEAGAAARVDLQQQGVRAADGQAFATRAAQDRAHGELGKVAQQLTGLDQSEGLRAATELGRLVDAAQGRSVTRRGQTLSSRDRSADRRSRETIAAANRQAASQRARAKPKRQWVTPTAQGAAADEVQRLARQARTLKARGWDRHKVAATLAQGIPAEKNGTAVVLPEVKAAKSELLLSAALDHTYDSHLSRKTQRQLHKRGVKVSPLGVTTYAQYRKKAARSAPLYGRKPDAGYTPHPTTGRP